MSSRKNVALIYAIFLLAGCATAPLTVQTKLELCPPDPPPETCPAEGDHGRAETLRDLLARTAAVERDLARCRAETILWRHGRNLCAKLANER